MNTFKIIFLFGVLTTILIVLGYLIGGTSGLIFFFVLSLVMNFSSYWFSSSIALRMAGAHELDQRLYGWVFQDTQELSQTMGIKAPKLYMSNATQPNAFATGRNQANAAVCFTAGLLNGLSQDEVRGVLAHELGHIKNNDILIATIAAVMASTISSIGNIFLFSGFNSRDREGTNPLAVIFAIVIAPLAATLIQFAISRNREFSADEAAAKYTRQPKSLANALIKIEQLVQRYPMNVNPAMSSLYIQNPFAGRAIMELFSTHPSTQRRVERLLKYQG
jgi:heat shock protein HtpX